MLVTYNCQKLKSKMRYLKSLLQLMGMVDKIQENFKYTYTILFNMVIATFDTA